MRRQNSLFGADLKRTLFLRAVGFNDGRRISVKMVLLSVSKTSRSIKVMDLIASDAGTVWEAFSVNVSSRHSTRRICNKFEWEQLEDLISS